MIVLIRRWRQEVYIWGGGGDDNLTFREGVRLNDVEKRMDYVEENPYGPWLVVCVGIINRRGNEPEIQRLHRQRWPLSTGVRPYLSRSWAPLVRLMLAACGPPAEQQEEPPCPQHGSEKSSFTHNKTAKRKKLPGRGPSTLSSWGMEKGEGLLSWKDTCSSRQFNPQKCDTTDRRRTLTNSREGSRFWQSLATGFSIRTHHWHLPGDLRRTTATDTQFLRTPSLSPVARLIRRARECAFPLKAHQAGRETPRSNHLSGFLTRSQCPKRRVSICASRQMHAETGRM